MKRNFYLVLAFFVMIQSNYAQIMSIEEYRNYAHGTRTVARDIGIPENITYIKDINNTLNKFEGFYVGIMIIDGFEATYQIRVEKIRRIYKPEYDLPDSDILILRHKILDNTGKVLEDTFGSEIGSNAHYMSGYNLYNTNTYTLRYAGMGRSFLCGNVGDVNITLLSPDKLNLIFVPDHDAYTSQENCPNGVAKKMFPTENPLELNRVNASVFE